MFDLVKIGPKKDDSVIINGMFLLRYSAVPLPHTLRGLVRHILIKALKMSEHRLDFVLNTKKVFYCSVDNECICLQCDEEGMLQVEDVHGSYGTYNEPDTCVAFHAVHVEQLNPGNIVVRCNDTDILIIILPNIQKFS